MKTKFLLPVLAMIFAIGMSFASADTMSDPNTDYYLVGEDTFVPIGMEVNCGEGTNQCQIRRDGEIYDLYDAPDHDTQKTGNGNIIEL